MGVIKLFATSTTLWVIALFISIFVLALVLFDDADVLELLNGILFSIAIGVLVTYGPSIFRSLINPVKKSTDYLLLGIGLSWTSIAMNRGVSAVWRALGRPEWFTNHWVWSFFIYIGLLAGTLHITAPHAINGKIPTQNWVRWGVWVSCGIAIAVTWMWFVRPSDQHIGAG